MSKRKILIIIAITVLSAVTGLTVLTKIMENDVDTTKEKIHAVLDLKEITDSSDALLTGYGYHMLSEFAANSGLPIKIRLARKNENCRDSVLAGSADILVRPLRSIDQSDSLLISNQSDSLFVWLLSPQDKVWMKEVNAWIDSWLLSERHDKAEDMYLKRYSPFSSAPDKRLSPYDSLLRVHADTTGNDWRFLASVIYKESRFHIEAESRRGAKGLMQLLPATAASFGVDDLLDPENNISAGARYIASLQKHYRRTSADRNELMKFTLAAYNAGMGRIDECIRFASSMDMDVSRWENIVAIIPVMNDSLQTGSDSSAYGRFRGTETVRYVENVIELYNKFSRMFPE